MESVYDRIKKLSDKQKISVRELGKRLDIGPTTLYKWKTQTPKSDVLMKVADYFSVSTDYLLGREHKLTVQEALDNIMSSDGKEIPDADKEVLARMIEGMLK